ncbi:branched-chain amino acid ABC transporter permease [Mangrovicoccus sp. HB161399]|uniref:branched-chain amino acid ABC transporter permease n=1 Tax=Mangrovicoccus sp. HB161399 TaxID=2720392 RepID=UPI0015520A5E|nr:branched-chain amino acid ABC transporter permease [Mangrovicoccus sp. HB161399]
MAVPANLPLRAAGLPALLIAGLGLVTLPVSLFAPPGVETFWTEILVRIILVTGFYIFIGNSGVFAFGHVAFACVGGYAAAWLSMNPMFKQIMLTGLPHWVQTLQLSPWAGVAAAAVMAALVALVVGAAIVRLSDIAASIATFAFLVVVNRIYSNWDSVTGGVAPLTNIPQFGSIWPTFLFAALALLTAYLFQRSRWGLMLKASRDDDVAALATGISVYRMRLAAFVLSAAVMGAGGAVYTYFLGILTVDVFYMGLTFLMLVMLVVGGAESLTGVVAGVIAVSTVAQILRLAEQGVQIGGTRLALPLGLQEITLGIFMVLVLVYRSDGITRGRELPLPRFLKANADAR